MFPCNPITTLVNLSMSVVTAMGSHMMSLKGARVIMCTRIIMLYESGR